MAGTGEVYVDDIRVEADLDALGLHDQINEDLVRQRAAGTPRIIESLQSSYELAADIQVAVVADEEVVTLVLDSRQHQILSISRRLGGIAAPLTTQR